MRTLFEIIEGARDGNKPTHDECYFAMLVLANIGSLDRSDLREVCTEPTPMRCKLKMEGSFNRFKRALAADPEKWLGSNVPGNPSYDRFRDVALRLMEKFTGQGQKESAS
jgi:hypothetical protein